MTKKELFEILANCPDDAEIWIDMLNDEEFDGGDIWLSRVRKPFPMVRMVKDGKIAQRPCEETSGAVKSITL
jgi:hypothetical protein